MLFHGVHALACCSVEFGDGLEVHAGLGPEERDCGIEKFKVSSSLPENVFVVDVLDPLIWT